MIVSNGVITIELRKSTIRDGWRRAEIVEQLQRVDNNERRAMSQNIFARVVSQSTKITGLSFPLPTEHDDDSAVKAVWENWTSTIDEDFEDELTVALNRLIKPLDEILGPLSLPEGAEKNS